MEPFVSSLLLSATIIQGRGRRRGARATCTKLETFTIKLMPSLRFISAMLSYVLLSLTSAGRRPAGAALVSAFSSSSVSSCAGTKLHYRRQHDATDTEQPTDSPMRVNLMTMPLPEMEELVEIWGFPKFRAKQIQGWIREKGVSDFDDMNNLPKKLRQTLSEHARLGSLELAVQADSKDGTIKRAYRLHDGQLIESVLMPYDDGRNTACISSQAGCAQACVFCATGQMGFARQLSSDEIFEQVARFDSELKGRGDRLSNVVFMGMGEVRMGKKVSSTGLSTSHVCLSGPAHLRRASSLLISFSVL